MKQKIIVDVLMIYMSTIFISIIHILVKIEIYDLNIGVKMKLGDLLNLHKYKIQDDLDHNLRNFILNLELT